MFRSHFSGSCEACTLSHAMDDRAVVHDGDRHGANRMGSRGPVLAYCWGGRRWDMKKKNSSSCTDAVNHEVLHALKILRLVTMAVTTWTGPAP